MDRTLSELVAEALRALDDDAPTFGEPLRAIAASPALLAALDHDADLHGALMPELRKLRPVPLWVRDEATRALRMKRVAFLDGAIATIARDAPTPAPEGRECWLQVPAEEATERVRTLGRGWGLVVAGDLHRTSFETLRRMAPLCALGAAISRPISLVPRVPLDLVVLEGTAGAGEVPGARVLRAALPEAELGTSAVSGQATGLVCTATDALSWALRLATVRPPRG